jgi:hypothetical protein
LNYIESPYRVKSLTSKAQFKKPKFKTPNTIKNPNTEKAQIEYYQKPKYVKSPN